MVLNLKQQLPASNKPPPTSPDGQLFASSVDFPDGKRVWVSYPQPDKVTINGFLLAEHFKEQFADTTPLSEKVYEFANGLKAAYALLAGKTPFEGKGNLLAKVQLPFGNRNSKVFIEVRQVKEADGFGFKMRMDFNPRKVGLAGCKQLQKDLQQAAMGEFHFGQFLADARLSRLDVAVDYTDVRPSDLIVTTKRKEGQRVHYLGTDGALETVQVHRPSKRPGVGTLAVKLYDRNRERKAHGKKPPYTGRQVTRLEIVKTRFSKKGFGLTDLPTMKNPLDVRLSYAASVVAKEHLKSWQRYLAARWGVGHAAAIKPVGVQPIIGSFLRKRYEGHPSNLLWPEVWVKGWVYGLQASGFLYLVHLALEAKKPSQ